MTCRLSEAELYKNILQIRSLQTKRSNTRKSEYVRCSRCSKPFSPFLGYRTSKVIYSYKVKLPDNTRHPSCIKLPCPRLLHPHPAGGELEKFRERLYQFIPHKRHQYIATTLRLIATNFLHPDLYNKAFQNFFMLPSPRFFWKVGVS